ncbi:uncharacterized protein LOC119328261 isoform X2 [Triticum dicoccoides]|uniref:uncharacterized protein LOC119328261 isoform X2 n=1 Tax=Triticum dicoccoides TaxID=85692 RepID=UPI001890E41F|nr:uncharacterized protein LOC119328261 isoform X2 [Triticum dicoccoides]XP_037457175.1 uncharacterized protein LOC119328261 isoform X2 [Triticum dicoccoides]XP_044428543.1 uncharacterized protein LOC123153511 isoform X2 [Triticum aestivum]XP_044428544.1 uncharacterized protein LOC123153511 isoform X2 [Triticum aestivum]
MGNSRSKAVDQQPEEDVTTDLTSSIIVEDNNASIIHVSQNIGENSATVPDGSMSFSDGEHNEACFTAPSILNLDFSTNQDDGTSPLRIKDHHDGSLLGSNNLTLDCGTNVDGHNSIGGEPPNDDIDGATKLTDDIRSIDLSHITNEHLNTQRRAAYHKKKVQDNVLLQEVQQPCLSKSDQRELNNAWRRESYRISKTNGLKKQQVDGHIVQRRTLGDITNVRQPTHVISGTSITHCLSIFMRGVPLVYHKRLLTYHVESEDNNVTKENVAITEEDRKRDHRNALRRASYRRKKDQGLQENNLRTLNLTDNPTSSAYTTLSHTDSAFTATTTETSCLVNDNDLHDVDENILEETNHITEEDRKRDHRNALRRASYRRKKDKILADENLRPLSNSEWLLVPPRL